MARKWWTLIAVSVATFMLLLDITVVNTALPSIEEDLGASFTELQWVVDAYALTLAAVLLPAAARPGKRRPPRGCSRPAASAARRWASTARRSASLSRSARWWAAR